MALPTINSVFAQVRVVDFWIEYPMSDFYDTATKIYKMRCQVNSLNYATIRTGASMASAVSAGVINLPVANTSARFCYDTPAISTSGGMLEFVRVFAMVPQARTDYATATYTSPPVYSKKTRVNTSVVSTSGIPQVAPSAITVSWEIRTPAQTKVFAARVEYSYTTTPETVPLLTESGFEVIQSPAFTAQSRYFSYSVLETNDGEKSVVVTGDSRVLEGTKITQWMGDIFEVATAYRV